MAIQYIVQWNLSKVDLLYSGIHPISEMGLDSPLSTYYYINNPFKTINLSELDSVSDPRGSGFEGLHCTTIQYIKRLEYSQ